MRRLILAVAAVALLAAACGEEADHDNAAQLSESATRQNGYEGLVVAQPAHTMAFSPTRQTINAWIDTWGQQGVLSFTYILNQVGDKVGYYVFQGPPVSYCASLTPNYERLDVDLGEHSGDAVVPAPSADGVYYSGGQCIAYYGIDASTGTLIEFTVGGTLNYVSSTQPLYLDAPPLGLTTVDDLTVNEDGTYTVEG